MPSVNSLQTRSYEWYACTFQCWYLTSDHINLHAAKNSKKITYGQSQVIECNQNTHDFIVYTLSHDCQLQIYRNLFWCSKDSSCSSAQNSKKQIWCIIPHKDHQGTWRLLLLLLYDSWQLFSNLIQICLLP